jgi:hypothetical protein
VLARVQVIVPAEVATGVAVDVISDVVVGRLGLEHGGSGWELVWGAVNPVPLFSGSS